MKKTLKFQDIYNMFYNEVYLYVFSLCSNHHLSQDIVSDVFYKALLSLDKTDESVKFWLFRIAKNLFIDYLRKQKRVSIYPLDDRKIQPEDNTIGKLIDSEARKELYRAVLSLPDSYKEVIVLFYYCDFTLIEIAESLNISHGAARNVIYRARKKLKDIIQKGDYKYEF